VPASSSPSVVRVPLSNAAASSISCITARTARATSRIP
jgi:hypothetical protein